MPLRGEQDKIAAVLVGLNDLIANNLCRIALLESMAEEIYREWFVRMRFPGCDSTQRVKLSAKRLLKRLVEEHPKLLVQDWFKDRQSMQQVRSEIERVLDEALPESYDRTTFKKKCDNVFDLAVDYANHHRRWAA